MKIKLTPTLCYLAGIQSRFKEENGAVGIITSIDAIEQHFIEICLKKLKLEPNKLLIESDGNTRHIFFYHSKLNKQLKQISENQTKLFRFPTYEARSYIAGIFDGSGYVKDGHIFIQKVSRGDEVLLENLTVHMKGTRVMSINTFISIINGYSVLLPVLNIK